MSRAITGQFDANLAANITSFDMQNPYSFQGTKSATQPPSGVTQQNQMIEKIYGRKTTFVHNRDAAQDATKKQKLQRMKEILRQKSSQQRR